MKEKDSNVFEFICRKRDVFCAFSIAIIWVCIIFVFNNLDIVLDLSTKCCKDGILTPSASDILISYNNSYMRLFGNISIILMLFFEDILLNYSQRRTKSIALKDNIIALSFLFASIFFALSLHIYSAECDNRVFYWFINVKLFFSLFIISLIITKYLIIHSEKTATVIKI